MKYDKITEGIFISRPNRFVATVEVNGKLETVHVKNTGRCKELLLEGARVYLSESSNPFRRTRYDLVAVQKERGDLPPLLINMDSAAPNEAVAEWLPRAGIFPEGTVFRREVTLGSSRFDFSAEYNGALSFLEVKGVTLEKNSCVSFPDAPTERGVKHLKSLAVLSEQGIHGFVIFVVQLRGAMCLRPNDVTHPEFGDALRAAEKSGVTVLALECEVTPESMTIIGSIPVDLSKKDA